MHSYSTFAVVRVMLASVRIVADLFFTTIFGVCGRWLDILRFQFLINSHARRYNRENERAATKNFLISKISTFEMCKQEND